MSRFYNLEQAPFNNRALARSIVASNNGLLFDPSDLSTLFQDAAGTVPVTAVGQPVGLVLDKSQGLQLGPELKAQYSIETLGSTTNLATYNPETGDGYAYRLDGSNASGIKLPVPSGKTYRIIVSISGGVLTIRGNGVVGTILVNTITTGAKTLTVYVPLGSDLWFSSALNASGVNFNIGSVKELYGNHATQPITASRPTLIYENGLYGLSFDGIDDYLNLPYMGLYANGSASIVAARDALSQTADTYVISERSTSKVNPKYFPSRQLANAGNMDSYIVNDAAAVVVDTVGSAYGGASDAVVRSAIDSGNNIKLFKNGALAANDNYTRSGTLTLTNTTIGASVSTTTSNYANMKLYGLCIAKSALSDLERRRVERLLAYNSGVQI